MYTEVKELVNFVCRYMFGRIPRRPCGIFAAELGNALVAQFSSSWDIKNPKKGEMERMVFIKCGEGSSKCFESCAGAAGLRSEEVLKDMPAQLRIFASPGFLYYRATEAGVDVPIWKGDVNADENYQPMPEHIVRAASGKAEAYSNLGGAGKPFMYGMKDTSTDLSVLEVVNNMFISLALEKWDDVNPNLLHIYEKYPFLFTYKPTATVRYTGIEFSQTRFGSTKPRQDLQTMVSLKNSSSTQHIINSTTNFSSPEIFPNY